MNEAAIRATAGLYEAQRSLFDLLGPVRFVAVTAPVAAQLELIARQSGTGVLEVALVAAKNAADAGDGHTALLFLASAAQSIEPITPDTSPKPAQEPTSGGEKE